MNEKPDLHFNWSTPHPEKKENGKWDLGLVLFMVVIYGFIYLLLATVPVCLAGVNPSWVTWIIPILIMGSAGVASGFAKLDQPWALWPALFFAVGTFGFPILLIVLAR